LEIERFLDETELVYDNYVIVDDDTDFLENQQEHFFDVDGYMGLTRTLCRSIITYLESKTEVLD
jgi:hypothetical protein